MLALLRLAFEYYNKALEEWSDPRVKDVLFFQGPLAPVLMLTFLFSYLIFCFILAPKFMEDREPYVLKKLLIVYNGIQIFINGWAVLRGTPYMLNYNWACSPIEYEDENSVMIPWGVQYGMIKMFDLLDTVFFVFRKKNSQITFLHVYHHFTMVFATWVAIKFFLGGPVAYIVYINCFVHTILYFYYLLCIIDEKHKKSIWWKKHLTQLQIAQFGFGFLSLFHNIVRECSFPKSVLFVMLIENFIFTCLFVNFYYKTYIQKKKNVNKVM